MKQIILTLVLSTIFASCTTITRVENFKELKNNSEAISYKDEKLKLHTNIFINNGKEKYYAHGLFYVPLFPTFLFSQEDSSLENDVMIAVTILGITKAKAQIQKIVINGTVIFKNLKGECKPGGNFVGCYFKVPYRAADAKNIDLNDFSYSIKNSSSANKNFKFKKESNTEWRAIQGSRYTKR